MNNEEVLADFRRRYENTIVLLCPEGKEEVLALIRAVDYDSNCVGRLHIQTKEYGELSMAMGSNEYTIKFKYPEYGVFQHGVEALYYYRTPQRQYQRGISSGNSVLSYANNMAGGGNQLTLNTVKAAFEHKTHTFKEAMGMLTNRKARSVALSNNYSIGLNTSLTDGLLLNHHRNIVALVSQDTGKISECLESSYSKILDRVLESL